MFTSSVYNLSVYSITDLLDNYIEAHIHEIIFVEDDIVYVVLDPFYRSSVVEEYALKLGIPMKWNNDYELSIEHMNLHPGYRGQQVIDVAKELAHDRKFNARLLGLAVTEHGYDEQDVKKIWHYLVRFGYLSIQA